jgi:hypothetical protein
MIVLGVILIALGIGWLMGFEVWAALLIGVGVVYILSAVSGRGRSSAWGLPACCYPEFWFGREPERRQAPEDDPINLQR